jgi:hypothetical protein
MCALKSPSAQCFQSKRPTMDGGMSRNTTIGRQTDVVFSCTLPQSSPSYLLQHTKWLGADPLSRTGSQGLSLWLVLHANALGFFHGLQALDELVPGDDW